GGGRNGGGSRLRGDACRRVLEADQTTNERVVAGVRRVGVRFRQELIESHLRRRNRRRDRDPRATQAWRPDGNEERFDRYGASRQVRDTSFDQVLARESNLRHRCGGLTAES